jgi:Na+:H+ antiporter, NhaA family
MRRIIHSDVGGGVLLAVAAVIALLVANSPWADTWNAWWHHPLSLGWPGVEVRTDARHIVDDGLMTLFFLTVGLEIRRELHDGAIADGRRAALPAAAALGGMLVPAAIYLAFNPHGPTSAGWGIPMATDIAFAVGVLALLGNRVPPALRVILLAIAILDDIGGIVVIALAYSSGIAPVGLLVAALGLVGALVLQRLRVRAIAPYLLPGLATWAGLLHAGIHPTMAGVIMGLATPPSGGPEPSPSRRVSALLHPWVVAGVLPLFALANAGVTVELGALELDVVLGVVVGLVVGKPLGVLVGAWLAVRTRLAALPAGVGWPGMLVVAVAAGIGFTVALFIGSLAFTSAAIVPSAKLGVLAGSLVAAIATVVIGRACWGPTQGHGARAAG